MILHLMVRYTQLRMRIEYFAVILILFTQNALRCSPISVFGASPGLMDIHICSRTVPEFRAMFKAYQSMPFWFASEFDCAFTSSQTNWTLWANKLEFVWSWLNWTGVNVSLIKLVLILKSFTSWWHHLLHLNRCSVILDCIQLQKLLKSLIIWIFYCKNSITYLFMFVVV